MPDNDKEFTYEIDKDFGDNIIEEGGNTSTNLRRISWNGKPHKIDLRKYFYKNGQEYMTKKGVGLSENGTHELTNTLVDKGYGTTVKLIKSLRGRADFDEALKMLEKGIDPNEGFHDPSELLKTKHDSPEDE